MKINGTYCKHGFFQYNDEDENLSPEDLEYFKMTTNDKFFIDFDEYDIELGSLP